MTKKSLSRIMRDKEKNKDGVQTVNYCWDELSALYSKCAALLGSHSNILALAHNKELLNAVSDKVALSDNIVLLAKDLKQISDDLAEIYNQHKDKTGGTTDPSELLMSYEILNQYHLFMTRHDTVIMPTVCLIGEQFDAAEKEILRKLSTGAEVVISEEKTSSDNTDTSGASVS